MILALIVIVTVLASLTALLMAMPRVYFAMARDGLFFRSAATLHPRFRTPARAILIQAGLASLLAALGTFEQILAYFTIPTVLFVGLSVAAVFVLNHAARCHGETAIVPWHPLPPLLFLVPNSILLGLMALNQPGQAGVGLAVVALGIPVYHGLFSERSSLQADGALPGPGENLSPSTIGES